MLAIEMLVNKQSECSRLNYLPENFTDVYNFHTSMKEYQKTPLHCLKSLASQLKVNEIYVKDESCRFGLNAFKGLGVSYALNEIIKKQPQEAYTFVSCTDGNHGKALAWRAKMLGQQAIIFMPKGSEKRRVRAIEKYQAKVIETDMNYDDTVRYAAAFAKEHNYHLVQDTALPGYIKIPNDIVLGYSTMIKEALDQMEEKPTHIFAQAGVGSMAGGVLWYLCHRYQNNLPLIGVIEANGVACIYESIRQKKTVSIGGEPYTAMAGLNCGEANFTTFPLLKAKANYFIQCKDEIAFKGMFRAKHPIGNDVSFNSGESGAVGLGFIEEVASDSNYKTVKEQLQINADSVILVFNTEGEVKGE